MPRSSPYLAEILLLDPERDHWRIVYLDTCHEFPFDITRSLEFALFRTFAVPSIGGLLDSTGEFPARPQKRYDDTDILISAMLEHGYQSDVGKRALRRMNSLHSRFEIANADFVYVLSSFVCEPIRWIDRFGWRRMVEAERLAHYHYWRQIGRRMNIRNIPGSYEELERFNAAYERERFAQTEASHRVGAATRDMFLAWFPFVPRRLGAPVIYALMDDALLDAFGFPRPRPRVRRGVEALLRARATALRHLPPRRQPRLRTQMRHRSYPQGYVLEELGPPPPGAAA